MHAQTALVIFTTASAATADGGFLPELPKNADSSY
jgi:hypothetical protein